MDELKPPRFPTMLRKMWSGGEVQAWIDENWNRRAQPEPAASADPSRDAYEGCREDLLDWKRRALKAEETCRQLTRALGEDVNGTTFMGEPVLPPRDAAPSVAPEPVAWTLQSELDAAQTTCSAHLWFTNPRNSAWTALFTREQIAARPPRAPLTDAEIDAMWQVAYPDLCDEPRCSFDWFEAGIRALEQAHGIGGK